MPSSISNNQGESQLNKFKDAARELECDENEATFEEKLKKIAKLEPVQKEKPE